MTSLPPDPWKTLGVDKTSDKAEIRAAYKKLVLKCHPDKVQDPAQKAQKQEEFQKVQQAYELLNDDNERIKYEEQVKLVELRKQAAAMMSKHTSNSSATRTPTRHYEIRTAEPRHKNSSTPSSGGKLYAHYASVHSRSHEEIPPRMYPFDDNEKHARRTASYEKTRRDDDRREKDERRRTRREDDERIRDSREAREARELREAREREIREKEREIKEREARRKKHEKDQKILDKERRRDQEEKRSRHKSPYIEDYDPEDLAKAERKRSSSKKPYEPREKSTSRRAPSPHAEIVQPPLPENKLFEDLTSAASYIERSKRSAPRASAVEEFIVPAPTPPPADDEEPRRMPMPIRTSGRRPSHEGSKSREKLSSSHSSHKQVFEILSSSPGARLVPTLAKTQSTPPIVPESPPRLSRASTTPHDFVQALPTHPPSFGRTQTWAPGEGARHAAYYEHEDSEDEHDRRRHRRSRRRSPERVRYKVVDNQTSRVDSQYYYAADSPKSARGYPPEIFESHSPSSPYPSQFKVREARAYDLNDVKYSDVKYNVSNDYYNQVSA